MSMTMDLSILPNEILVEILLFAAYRNIDFARVLTRVSSWTNKLAQRAIFSTVSVINTYQLRRFLGSLGLIKGPFPVELPVADLFRLSFKDIPQLNPSQVARERARLIHNLWLIPTGIQERLTNLDEHVYTRLVLHLCMNVRSLAMTGTAFSHFLISKSTHFLDVTALDTGGIVENDHSPYPRLTHLTLLDSTPALIMEGQYSRAEEYVKIFKQLTHFITYGFHHRNGIPISIQHFPSLTHVALPLILSSAEISDADNPSTEDIYACTGGWQLLQSARQIQMLVFLFPNSGQLHIGTHLSSLMVYHPPLNLILGANRLDNRAYALPIDGLNGLYNLWYSETRGGQSIWEAAKEMLHRSHGF